MAILFLHLVLGIDLKLKIPIGIVVKKTSNRDKEFSDIEIKPFEKIGQMSELILIWDYKPKDKINE